MVLTKRVHALVIEEQWWRGRGGGWGVCL